MMRQGRVGFGRAGFGRVGLGPDRSAAGLPMASRLRGGLCDDVWIADQAGDRGHRLWRLRRTVVIDGPMV